MKKNCTKCGVEKELSEFYKRKLLTVEGFASECKICKSVMGSKWAKNNPSKVIDKI